MAQIKSRWQVPAALIVLGTLFAGAGGLLRGPLAAGAAEEADALWAAPVVDARSLSAIAAGTRVLAYGRILTAAEMRHGLVAFVHEQYEGTETTTPNKGRPRWRSLARQTPALQLEVDGGLLPIAAGDYALESARHERAPDGGPVEGTLRLDLRLVDLSTQRVRGFAAGDAVTVDGALTAAADGTFALQPQRLFGGDVSAYRATRGGDVAILPVIGALFIAAGLLLFTLGGAVVCRGRLARPASQGEPS